MPRPPFDGDPVEPRVGAIRVLRTFTLADDGALLPVTPIGQGRAWVDGENVAMCTRGLEHRAPAEGCTCGFYAYGAPEWVDRPIYHQFLFVQAVVECYGKVIAGEVGVKAEKAQVIALCMGRQVPSSIVTKVGARYPSATLYQGSPRQMLREHSLTDLDTYRRRLSGLGRAVHGATPWAGAGALAVGVGLLGHQLWGWVILLLAPWLCLAGQRVGWFPPRTALRIMAYGTLGAALVYLGSVVAAQGLDRQSPIVAAALLGPPLVLCAVAAAGVAPRRGIPWMQRRFRLHPRSAALKTISEVTSERVQHRERIVLMGPRRRRLLPCETHLVHLVTYPSGVVAFAQSQDPGMATEDVLAMHGSWLRAREVRAVAVVTEDAFTQVAVRVQASGARFREHIHGGYLLTAPLPLAEAVAVCGLPDRLWCPETLLARVQEDVLAGSAVRDRYPLVFVGYPRFSGSDAATALEHAQALAGREFYRQTQAQIAAAGVTPLTGPTLPETIPLVDSIVVARGWAQMLRFAGPEAGHVEALYAAVQAVLPEQARVRRVDQQHVPHLGERAYLHLGYASVDPDSVLARLVQDSLGEWNVAIYQRQGTLVAIQSGRSLGDHHDLVTEFAVPTASLIG